MAKLKTNYVCFYLDGREAKVIKNEINETELAEKILNGEGSLRDVIYQAACDAAKPLEIARQKQRWVREEEDAIKEAGGDENEAYRHYMQGRTDELAYVLEPDVIEAMSDLLGEDGEEEKVEKTNATA